MTWQTFIDKIYFIYTNLLIYSQFLHDQKGSNKVSIWTNVRWTKVRPPRKLDIQIILVFYLWQLDYVSQESGHMLSQFMFDAELVSRAHNI